MTPEKIKVYQEKFESVQCQINEVIRSEKERKQIRIEVEAILQGYQDYLERDGFGVSEIQLILSKLTFNRVLLKMTSKEALKCLQPFRWDDKEEIKAYEVLEELVERDTPKKIEYNDYEDPCCPDCGEVQCSNVYAMNNNFCPYCGQRLDWSEWYD